MKLKDFEFPRSFMYFVLSPSTHDCCYHRIWFFLRLYVNSLLISLKIPVRFITVKGILKPYSGQECREFSRFCLFLFELLLLFPCPFILS